MGARRIREQVFLWLLVFFLPVAAAAADKNSGGVGLAVVPTAEGELVVLKVMEKSPAAASGMRSGDFILQVDDFPLRGSDFAEVSSRRLRGEVGTPVTLQFLRPGEKGVHTVVLKRIPLDSGRKETLDGKGAAPLR